jgi:hypothetical protein
MVEVAIAETEEEGGKFFGLNYSAPFGDPLAGVELSNKAIEGYGLSGFLTEAGVYNGDFYGRRLLKTAAAFHLVMPVLPTLDRGKSRLSTPREVNAAAAEIMAAAAKTLTVEFERWRRNRSKVRSEYAAAEKETKARARSEQMTKAEVVNSILLETYLEVTENETLYVTARDLYYAIRPKFNDLDVRSSKDAHGRETDELNFGYFSQTVLPAFRREHHLSATRSFAPSSSRSGNTIRFFKSRKRASGRRSNRPAGSNSPSVTTWRSPLAQDLRPRRCAPSSQKPTARIFRFSFGMTQTRQVTRLRAHWPKKPSACRTIESKFSILA